jgi:hypothetical protein
MPHRKLLLLILIGGGFNMSMATTKTTQAIIDHAKEHLSLSEKDITLIETPISQLPNNLDVYYVEKKGSYGHDYYHYIVSGEDLFCSAEKDSFEKLLKKERFLEKKNFTVDQLITLFSLLKVKFRDVEVVKAEDLAPGGSLQKYAKNAAPPAMTESKDGVKVVFWTSALGYPEPQKWEFTIFPGYRVEYQGPRPE